MLHRERWTLFFGMCLGVWLLASPSRTEAQISLVTIGSTWSSVSTGFHTKFLRAVGTDCTQISDCSSWPTAGNCSDFFDLPFVAGLDEVFAVMAGHRIDAASSTEFALLAAEADVENYDSSTGMVRVRIALGADTLSNSDFSGEISIFLVGATATAPHNF